MPNELKGDAAEVARHYDGCVQAETARLEKFSPVEYAITLRYLARSIPEHSDVAEVGVGAGHYSEFLARRGCRLQLVDVSEGLLCAATERLTTGGLAARIAGIHHASATALPLADASLDAILLLGPLYHLRDRREREQAVAEAARVLRPGGTVAAAGVNRIAFLRDMFRSPDAFTETFFGEEFASAGRAFGRRRFFPEISPNKTLEGAVGGLICAGIGISVEVLFAKTARLPLVGAGLCRFIDRRWPGARVQVRSWLSGRWR